jgi:hypothetical protein
MKLHRVVSGGQTGVDRAALDAAMACGIPIGGWCPKGRRAEDGFVPRRYPLRETPSRNYVQRTTWNVRDSDGTLVLYVGALTGGSLRTTEVAAKLGKPCLALDLDLYLAPERAWEYLEGRKLLILNVAGPRESGRPGIHARAHRLLMEVFTRDERQRRYTISDSQAPPQ